MLLPNQTQAISDMSALLYDFLPGKAHPYANQEISFLGVARKVGLDKHWLGGSKQPSIAMLLSRTYEFDKGRFCDLITTIINYGIIYRTQKKNPVTRDEIEKLNAMILKLSFKIPQLWDKNFLDNLSGNKKKTAETSAKLANYDALLTAFMKLKDMDNSQSRGFAFEKFLNELFDEFELNPRKSFKLVGEQIDGSLELDKEIYLIEAKWQKTPLGQSDLLIFNGKIEGKSKWTRGIIISYNGISREGVEAFSRGRSTNLITIDGADLYAILSKRQPFSDVVRMKIRWAAETGEIAKSVFELLD